MDAKQRMVILCENVEEAVTYAEMLVFNKNVRSLVLKCNTDNLPECSDFFDALEKNTMLVDIDLGFYHQTVETVVQRNIDLDRKRCDKICWITKHAVKC